MIAALVLAAAVSASPTIAELQSLLAAARVDAAKVRDIRCEVLGDPTEHRCDWRQKTAKGRWEAWSVILARDGGRWILIDTPGRASRP
jgi:hypothetical protein